jgi:hypothetical protein
MSAGIQVWIWHRFNSKQADARLAAEQYNPPAVVEGLKDVYSRLISDDSA